MTYKQGDTILVWYPDSNLLTAKKRPAIILQTDNLNTGLDQLIIGMITSNLERRNHPSRIFVDVNTPLGKKTGIISNSVIMTDNIATIRTSEIYRKLGVFEDSGALKASIRHTFGV